MHRLGTSFLKTASSKQAAASTHSASVRFVETYAGRAVRVQRKDGGLENSKAQTRLTQRLHDLANRGIHRAQEGMRAITMFPAA